MINFRFSGIIAFALILILSCNKTKPVNEGKHPSKEKAKAEFSGIITAKDGKPMDIAIIEINGKKTESNKEGLFSITVDSSSRYIVNVRKQGYSLISKVLDKPFSKRKFRLTEGTTKLFDPKKDIELVDINTRNAPGSDLQNVDWTSNKFYSIPLVLDKQGNLVDLGFQSPAIKEAFTQIVAGPVINPGATIKIKAGSLVDKNNNPPGGKVKVILTTIDLYSEDGMPGDYSFVNNTTGARGFMQSMGAASIEIFSEDGKMEYQLRDSKKEPLARLSIPIDKLQTKLNKKLPDSISLLVYNATNGLWEHSHAGVFNKNKKAYEAPIYHFSEYNMDVEKMNPACIKFKQQSGFDRKYKVASINYSGGLTYSTTNQGGIIDEDQLPKCPPTATATDYQTNMLYNLPSTAAPQASALNEICIIFYTNDGATTNGSPIATDPLAIYLVPIPDAYGATRPQCSDLPAPYNACQEMTTITKGTNLVLAGKFDAGGGVTLKWIYNGSPSTLANPYHYSIIRKNSGGVEDTLVLDAVINDPDPKDPTTKMGAAILKRYQGAGISSGDEIRIEYIGGPGGLSSASPAVSNRITKP